MGGEIRLYFLSRLSLWLAQNVPTGLERLHQHISSTTQTIMMLV